jgi:fluoride exporter
VPRALTLVLLVAVAGGLGCVARYGLALGWARWLPGWPFWAATMTANFLGCLLLGYTAGRWPVGSDAAVAVGTGFCGGLTTFSTMIGETSQLGTPLSSKAMVDAAGVVTASVVLGLLAYSVGLWLAGRRFA